MIGMTDPDEGREAWSDPALVLGARRGDRGCFDVLVRRHHERARAVARAICADPIESQDVTQEAFIRAWTNLDLLVDPARFGAWVRRIAFACGIDWLRSRPVASPDTLLASLASSEPPAESALADHQLATAVRAAVDRLPPRYRRPLVLYHLDGLRQERIAAALGVAPGTVRSLVTRARQALRSELAAVADELLCGPTPRALVHICNGHATSRPLETAGVPGQFKLCCDPLLEGPCPPLWDEEWRELRLRFLQGPDGHAGAGAPAPGEEVWDRDVARILSAPEKTGELVLWYEHDLYDQLLLIRLLALFARHRGERPPISLVCIGEHPAVPAFMGLGQLTPDQLASLFDTRSPIDEVAIALGRDAWTAYTDPDPRRLEAFLGRDLSPLPFLARALRRHLEEYPGLDDGLSRTERQLLTLVQDGVNDATRAWQQLHVTEDCFYIMDSSYRNLLDRMLAPPAPLLAVGGQVRLSRARPAGTLSLTPLAEKVLAGRCDWLRLTGVDRWLGGVHLTDPVTAWRWDPTLRRVGRRDN
jgi:RNA polymerase sigma factor (sigma-70 family)